VLISIGTPEDRTNLGCVFTPQLHRQVQGATIAKVGFHLKNDGRCHRGSEAEADDDLGITYSQWRQDWIAAGMPWRSVGMERPPHWNPRQQFTRVMEIVMLQSK
jgi:hypothetical protein